MVRRPLGVRDLAKLVGARHVVGHRQHAPHDRVAADPDVVEVAREVVGVRRERQRPRRDRTGVRVAQVELVQQRPHLRRRPLRLLGRRLGGVGRRLAEGVGVLRVVWRDGAADEQPVRGAACPRVGRRLRQRAALRLGEEARLQVRHRVEVARDHERRRRRARLVELAQVCAHGGAQQLGLARLDVRKVRVPEEVGAHHEQPLPRLARAHQQHEGRVGLRAQLLAQLASVAAVLDERREEHGARRDRLPRRHAHKDCEPGRGGAGMIALRLLGQPHRVVEAHHAEVGGRLAQRVGGEALPESRLQIALEGSGAALLQTDQVGIVGKKLTDDALDPSGPRAQLERAVVVL